MAGVMKTWKYDQLLGDGDAWEFPSFQIKIKMPGIAQFSDLVLLQEM